MAKRIVIASPAVKKQPVNKLPVSNKVYSTKKTKRKIKVKRTNRHHKKQNVVIDNSSIDWLDVDYPELKVLISSRRKELIKKQTQAESMMLKLIRKQEDRNRKNYKCFQLGAVEFNFPFVIDPAKSWFYFADFYFKDLGIVIELDGLYHNEPTQQKRDEAKDKWYSSQGFRVLRMTNTAFTGTGYDKMYRLLELYASVPAGTIKKLDKPIQQTI
jgi:very-short-patch-repair endonuclease